MRQWHQSQRASAEPAIRRIMKAKTNAAKKDRMPIQTPYRPKNSGAANAATNVRNRGATWNSVM